MTQQLENIQILNDKAVIKKDEIHSQLDNLTKENENMQNMVS
jgi:hypothetical protein